MRAVKTITLDDARRVIAAGEKEAANQGQPMNIAVVDAGGSLVAHIRQDGAWIGSVDVCINKAFDARAFDIPARPWATTPRPAASSTASRTRTTGGS